MNTSPASNPSWWITRASQLSSTQPALLTHGAKVFTRVGDLLPHSAAHGRLEYLLSRDQSFDVQRLQVFNPHTPAGRKVIELLSEDGGRRPLRYQHGYNHGV